MEMVCRHYWQRGRVPAKAQYLAKLTVASMASQGRLSGSVGANHPAQHAPDVSTALTCSPPPQAVAVASAPRNCVQG
jgi:hypothetical protein